MIRLRKMMPHTLWVILMVAVVLGMACGCKKKVTAISSAILPNPNDLTLDLGEEVTLKLVWIEPLSLLVGKAEISNAQYRRFNLNHDSGMLNIGTLNLEKQPAVNVTWTNAQAFCDWLTDTYGLSGNRLYQFRLPTEKEWRRFATCDQDWVFPWGNEWPPPNDLNYCGEEHRGAMARMQGHRDDYVVSAPVEEAGVNAWRVVGTAGNVWEWCADALGDGGVSHPLLGGSWNDFGDILLRMDHDKVYPADTKNITFGFRVVANIKTLTDEELATIVKDKKEKEEKILAEKKKAEEEEARKAAEAKSQSEREKTERQANAQADIKKQVAERRYDLAAGALDKYLEDFGKDEFYDKLAAVVTGTKMFSLADDVLMELVRIESLKIWVDKFEVTNKEYRKFKPDHDSGQYKEFSLNGDDQPVVKVSHEDAKAYCQWLNEKFAERVPEGMTFRLPTEDEWEQCALCGEARDFPWGKKFPPKYGNYGASEDYDDGLPVSCPVAESGQNEWGLFGVGGNVWEWCEGWFDGQKKDRVIRGGAWNLIQPDAMKVANRQGDSSDQRNNYIGFRVVIGPKLAEE